jgi:trans-aconitate 2-methyltransferase
MSWDAGVYLRFANERTQPSIDLIQRINLAHPRRIIDLGCGPGNSTEPLRQRWIDAEVIGLDSSAPMIEAARKAYPNRTWLTGDAATWKSEEPFDLVFSNAMLQWLPDHPRICRQWFDQVAPGGALAVQIPAHYDLSMNREIVEVSKDLVWNDRMQAARASLKREPPSLYYDALEPVAAHIDLWETIYHHILPGPQAVLDWFRGTGLRPYLEALSTDEERQRFERLLLEKYEAAYPRRAGGQVLFPFRRLFFVAYRA